MTPADDLAPLQRRASILVDGVKRPFREQVEGEGGRLPTASTCFNTLRLPAYASEAALGERLRAALANSAGFDEHAVAQ
jgi:hypothetical protein